MSPIMALFGMDRHVHESRISLHRVVKLTGTGLVYASLVGLTACATSAEVESLRAEVAKANATAIHAEAEISRTQRELNALKAAATPPAAFSKPKTPPTTPLPLTRISGYKWGKLPQY